MNGTYLVIKVQNQLCWFDYNNTQIKKYEHVLFDHSQALLSEREIDYINFNSLEDFQKLLSDIDFTLKPDQVLLQGYYSTNDAKVIHYVPWSDDEPQSNYVYIDENDQITKENVQKSIEQEFYEKLGNPKRKDQQQFQKTESLEVDYYDFY